MVDFNSRGHLLILRWDDNRICSLRFPHEDCSVRVRVASAALASDKMVPARKMSRDEDLIYNGNLSEHEPVFEKRNFTAGLETVPVLNDSFFPGLVFVVSVLRVGLLAEGKEEIFLPWPHDTDLNEIKDPIRTANEPPDVSDCHQRMLITFRTGPVCQMMFIYSRPSSP